MNYWIRIASFLVCLHFVGSADTVVEMGNGRCQKQWTVPERRAEFYTVREQCKYYERCYFKTVSKSRTTIVDKPMHVDFCCEGYTNVGSSYLLDCRPICEPMCVFGECTAPGNCTCNEGYVKSSSSNHICEHTCTPECVNATCAGVNHCECYAGFSKKDPGTPHTCSPRCFFGCVHGDCTAPEICTCHPGYTLSSNHSICVPVCNLECTHGICSNPNTCTCDDGYIETPIWNICEPYCSEPCVNGQCTSPESCTCWNGYIETSNFTCDPHCSNACNNGACIAPEICSCGDGYEKDENDTCIPVCSLGCDNGTCVSPDNCICGDHHYFSNGTCLPWCAEGCTNGDCTGPTDCRCHEDTFRLSPSYCAQSCSNVDDCIDHSSSINARGNLTTLNLIWDSVSARENQPLLCTKAFSESCCSIGLNFTEGDSLVIICSPKDNNAECDDHILTVRNYLWTALHYENRNDTNMTVTIIVDRQLSHYDESDARACYVQLCPGSAYRFVTGETRISCQKDSDVGNLKILESSEDHLPITATVYTLTVLTAVAIVAAVFYYFKRVRKISYEVNTGAAGESTAQILCHDQEVILEDEF